MSVQGIKFGLASLGGIRYAAVQKTPLKENFAQNFQRNFSNGELVPVVQNDVLANKLNVFA